MKPNWILMLVLVVLSSFVKSSKDELVKKIDSNISNIQLKTAENTTSTLAVEMKNNGLIIIFSCNTCPFVVGNDEFPGWEKSYNSIYKQANKNSLGLVLINSNEGKRENEDSLEEMKNRAKKKKYKMPYLLDEKSVIANAFKAKTTPHVFVVNTNLEIIYQGSIDNSWDNSRKENENYLSDLINKIATKKEITINATEPRGCSIKRKK